MLNFVFGPVPPPHLYPIDHVTQSWEFAPSVPPAANSQVVAFLTYPDIENFQMGV